jgi:hypothetical protein
VADYGLGPDGLIFTGPRGGAVRRTTFSDTWIAAAGPLGIPLGDGYHQLRHFYASVLIRAGESVKVVQERLGHTSAEMTLDIYSHLWPEDEDRTRTAVDAVLGAPANPTETPHGVENWRQTTTSDERRNLVSTYFPLNRRSEPCRIQNPAYRPTHRHSVSTRSVAACDT